MDLWEVAIPQKEKKNKTRDDHSLPPMGSMGGSSTDDFLCYYFYYLWTEPLGKGLFCLSPEGFLFPAEQGFLRRARSPYGCGGLLPP